MAGGTGTNVALRTMVMIGALLVLLLMALLPGSVGWLVGGGQAGERERDPVGGVGRERGATDVTATIEQGADRSPNLNAHPEKSSLVVAGTGDAMPVSDIAAGETVADLSAGETAPVDRCWSITAQLRQEGAAYYRLESWENEPCVFRFQCTMPVSEADAGDEQAYRTFEAAGSDPADAMERVLADVRAWNAAGRF